MHHVTTLCISHYIFQYVTLNTLVWKIQLVCPNHVVQTQESISISTSNILHVMKPEASLCLLPSRRFKTM